MRFGFVARFTLSLAILAFVVFLLKVFYHQQATQQGDQPVVVKQPLPSPTAQKMPDFAKIIDIRQKKRAFFDFIRPGVMAANQKIEFDRHFLTEIKRRQAQEGLTFQGLTTRQQQRYSTIANDYKTTLSSTPLSQINQLLIRVDTIPKELVMVQAANESGWGTSRFARLGLNFFGQWCFSKGCGLVPSSRNDDASHEVKVFSSVDQSISSYLRNLNTHPAYKSLREIRYQLRQNNLPVTASDLAPGLINYSQRQQDYVIELLQMLRHNKAYL